MERKNAKTLETVHTHTHTLCLLNNEGKEGRSGKEKGSVTVFTVVSCMFILIVILMVNIGLINKITNQEKEIAQITKNYNVTDDEMEQAYLEATEGENRYLTMKEVRDMVYPVGSIYMSTSDKNPGEIMGGTWERYANGKTIVGEGEGTDSNGTKQTFTANSEGGEYTHKLTIDEMPSHTHKQNPHSHEVGFDTKAPEGICFMPSPNGFGTMYFTSSSTTFTNGKGAFFMRAIEKEATNQNTGGDQSHNNVQPYIVTYIWKRTQ